MGPGQIRLGVYFMNVAQQANLPLLTSAQRHMQGQPKLD